MPGVMPGDETLEDVMLQRYLDYNLWANRRLVENIRAVPADLVEWVPLAPFGSIHDALRHIVGAQNIWLERLRGESPSDFMGLTAGRSTDDLCEMLVLTSQAWIQHVESHPSCLGGTISYATTKGDPFVQEVSDVVMHVVNHSTYHRGQVMSALRSVFEGRLHGLDLIAYSRTR